MNLQKNAKQKKEDYRKDIKIYLRSLYFIYIKIIPFCIFFLEHESLDVKKLTLNIKFVRLNMV